MHVVPRSFDEIGQNTSIIMTVFDDQYVHVHPFVLEYEGTKSDMDGAPAPRAFRSKHGASSLPGVLTMWVPMVTAGFVSFICDCLLSLNPYSIARRSTGLLRVPGECAAFTLDRNNSLTQNLRHTHPSSNWIIHG